MRCLSHILIFKKHRTFKNFYEGMEKTQICYFCSRKIKKMNEKQFRSFDKEFSKTRKNTLLINQ